MNLETLLCNSCGAPLEVPGAAQYVRCNHCGVNLAVRRGGSASYTEAMANLAEHSERIASDVAVLKQESALARIDREWELEREQYMIETKSGKSLPAPSAGDAIGTVVGVVFLIFWMGAAIAMGAGFMAIFGVAGLAMLIFTSISHHRKHREYQEAEVRYRQRRDAAMRQE